MALPALIIKFSASPSVASIFPAISIVPAPEAVCSVSIVVVPAVLKTISAVLKARLSFFVEIVGEAPVIRIPFPVALASKVVPPSIKYLVPSRVSVAVALFPIATVPVSYTHLRAHET